MCCSEWTSRALATQIFQSDSVCNFRDRRFSLNELHSESKSNTSVAFHCKRLEPSLLIRSAIIYFLTSQQSLSHRIKPIIYLSKLARTVVLLLWKIIWVETEYFKYGTVVVQGLSTCHSFMQWWISLGSACAETPSGLLVGTWCCSNIRTY